MAKTPKDARYVEPADYFPVEIRKKLKLGEFAEQKPEKSAEKKGEQGSGASGKSEKK